MTLLFFLPRRRENGGMGVRAACVTQCESAPAASSSSGRTSSSSSTSSTSENIQPEPAVGAEGGQPPPKLIKNPKMKMMMIPNPGPFEQASMEVKRLVNLDTFDGFRCDIHKQVSPFMAAVHSFWLGGSTAHPPQLGSNNNGNGKSSSSTYTFLTQVADEHGSLWMARVDPSRGWCVDGRIHRAFSFLLPSSSLLFSMLSKSTNSTHHTAHTHTNHTDNPQTTPSPSSSSSSSSSPSSLSSFTTGSPINAVFKLQMGISPPPSSATSSGTGGEGGDGGNGSTDQLLAEVDLGGPTWTANVKYGSMGGGIVYGGNYYQQITSRLSMGGEGMFIAANQSFMSQYLIKYWIPASSTPPPTIPTPTTATATATTTNMNALDAEMEGGDSDHMNSGDDRNRSHDPSSRGSSMLCLGFNAAHGAATLGYRRVVTPKRVQLASELQFSPFTLDSKLLLAAEFALTRSKLHLCVDAGEGRIQTVLETKLGMAPGSPTLNLSADVNHFEDEMRFGYGLNIDG